MSAPVGSLDLLARRLLDDVRRKAGIRHDRPLERKLTRILSAMPLAVLELWVAQIEAADPDSPDWLSLIENLTIHETYFFRDPLHHEHVRRRVLPALIATRQSERRLRLWSAGCASGEEAYGLAILTLEALADLGEAQRGTDGIVTGWDVAVLGTDISRIAVRQARHGSYGEEGMGAFRDLPDAYAPWFVPLVGEVAPCRRVREDARRLVRFERHNLMGDALPADHPFDLVSCRNVMIYFDDESRDRAMRLLIGRVAADGWLVLGATDRLPDGAPFERVHGDRAVAYRRAVNRTGAA